MTHISSKLLFLRDIYVQRKGQPGWQSPPRSKGSGVEHGCARFPQDNSNVDDSQAQKFFLQFMETFRDKHRSGRVDSRSSQAAMQTTQFLSMCFEKEPGWELAHPEKLLQLAMIWCVSFTEQHDTSIFHSSSQMTNVDRDHDQKIRGISHT
jgi:hypothetical protein